jgi:hypothetical protein
MQSYGINSMGFLVSIGYTKDEVRKILTKKKKPQELIDASLKEWPEARAFVTDDNGCPLILAFCEEFEDSWETYELLIHEITHVVQGVREWMNGGRTESEFEAYLMQYLFSQIRRKALGIIPSSL